MRHSWRVAENPLRDLAENHLALQGHAGDGGQGYIRPFLQISQNSPYGTVWFVTDWHMRNVTAVQKVQDTADATAAAVDS